MSRDETFRGERTIARAPAGEDVLSRALRELPVRGPTSASHQEAPAGARATFLRAFEDAPWYAKALASAGRASVPVVLASVVGLYLFWAFAAAIALNQ